jgi:hypothetical protein
VALRLVGQFSFEPKLRPQVLKTWWIPFGVVGRLRLIVLLLQLEMRFLCRLPSGQPGMLSLPYWAEIAFLALEPPSLIDQTSTPDESDEFVILTLPGNGAIRHTGTQTFRSTPTVDQNMDVPQETEHERENSDIFISRRYNTS